VTRAGAKPITRQSSEWRRVEDFAIGGVSANVWVRNTHDGQLRSMVGEEPPGWHLSISHIGAGRRPGRYPTWDEIRDARDRFLPGDLGFVMHLPPEGEYVAVHDTTFHLWEFDQ
jgi:hypothetical protein